MFFAFANAIVSAKSDVFDALTEYTTIFPSAHGEDSGVKGSQLSLRTAGAIMEDEDTSLRVIHVSNVASAHF